MSKQEKTKAVENELNEIRRVNRGILRPSDVVEYARNRKTALHKRFTWDDSKAANEYRLWQAREIISVFVKVIKQDTDPIRIYVSMTSDRRKKNGGYRTIESVLANPKLRSAFLEQALEELQRLEEKYKQLEELAEIFAAVKKIKRKNKSVA